MAAIIIKATVCDVKGSTQQGIGSAKQENQAEDNLCTFNCLTVHSSGNWILKAIGTYQVLPGHASLIQLAWTRIYSHITHEIIKQSDIYFQHKNISATQ